MSAALSSIGNAVVITDREGTILWVNQAFTVMSGYEPAEVVGATPRKLKSGVQDEPFYRQLWATILQGRGWRGELVNRHRSGRLYRVVQTITPIVDANSAVTHLVAVHEDVTELREGQARIRALFDHALDAVVFFNDEGRCIDANPVACELAGRELAELTATPIERLLAGKNWHELWSRFGEDGRRTGSCQVQRSDGRRFEIDVQVVTEVMPGVHAAVCRDVTEQRQLQVERDFQAQLVEAAGAAVIATDLVGRVIFWNEAASQLYGWSQQQVLGRDIREVNVVSDAAEQAEQIMSQVRAGHSWTGEFEVRRRDGSTFPALVTNAPYLDSDGRVAGIIGVSTDVSELHLAQRRAQLRASQQTAVAELGRRALSELNLGRLFDDAVKAVAAELDVPLVAVLELDDDGRQLTLRAADDDHHRLVGVTTIPNDLRTQAGYTLACNDTVTVDELATETRFTPPPQMLELGVQAAASTPIRGRDASYGVLAALTTVARRFTDDEVVFLETLAAMLGGAIARDRIETQLQATVDRLARSEEIRVAFLRATSHELRTPLAALVGFAETLARRDEQLDADQRHWLLDRLQHNATRLSLLIEDLLDVDRLTTGLVTANRTRHDLRELIRRVADEQPLHGRRLERRLDEVDADVDAPKFERIVANLLANAVRHTPEDATIRILLRRDPGGIQLAVEDDGEGIPTEYLDQVFEPFVQGPAQQQAPQPGTGLGLTLARQFALLHGGDLTATNRDQGGARFEVTLPTEASP